MEGGSGVAEAERWLTIAAKLLAARDLHGTRTFALRARESDPRYEGSSQILAIANTLIAAESLVNNHPDWYAVLQLVQITPDQDLIATQYRKLFNLLHPVRNKLAFADLSLKLVCDAWSVLSDPIRKSIYDNELQLIELGQLPTNQPETPNQQRQPQTPFQQRQSPNQQPQLSIGTSLRNKDGAAAAERPILVEPTRPASEIRSTQAEIRPNRPASSESRPIRAFEQVPKGQSFWTACPYCYVLFEYPKVYEECTLRCQNCRRAFHAAVISPPPATDGKDSYFCSWGFFPLGFSGNAKATGGSCNWSPVSAMFACPLQGVGKPPPSRKFRRGHRGVGRPGKNACPDDQDMLIEISEPSDDSNGGDDDDYNDDDDYDNDEEEDDDEWECGKKRKKDKNGKGKGLVGRPPKSAQKKREG